MPADDLVQVGVITAAHGVRGQVKIRSLTDNPEDMFSCGALSDTAGNRLFQVEKHAGIAPVFIVTLKGVNDRNMAESLKGTALFTRAESLPERDRVQHEIVGLEAKLETGKIYGRITGMYNFGAGDIIEIELAGGNTEMLPLDKKFVEVKESWVLVHPPEYVEGK